jgi:regulator of sigma D
MADVDPFAFMKLNKQGWSSSVEEATQWFPRRESNAPRIMVYRNECPDLLTAFDECLDANSGQTSACIPQKDELEDCGMKIFRIINAMTTPYDYAKGLPK